MRLRWRGVPLDLLLAASGVGLDLLLSGNAPVGEPGGWSAAYLAVLVGAPMGFVRHRPAFVALYLAAMLVLTDHVGAFTSNAAQILLCLAIGLAGYKEKARLLVPVIVVGCAASAVNILDPGVPVTTNAWIFSVLLSLAPGIVGCYLANPLVRPHERNVTADVLLAAGGVAESVLTTWTDWHGSGQPVWVIGLLSVVAGLSLGIARQLPGLVFVFQGALLVAADTYLPDVVTTCLILTLVTIGVFAMRVGSWLWTGVVYLAGCFLAATAIVDAPGDTTVVRAAVLMGLVATPVAIGRNLGARQATAVAERAAARESARHAVAQVRADQLAERERIAREVHDIVAHHVGAMVLRAGAAHYAAPEGPVADALADIRNTGHQALEDLRGLLDVLRDPEGDAHLLADPGDVVREAAERMTAAGLLVDLALDPAVDQAPLVARASAARIVQEGLTNVLKHAGPGTRVCVNVRPLGPSAPGLSVRVHNDRPSSAAPPLPSSGQGLAGSRERVRALGGVLTAGPDGEGGWLLSATLPTARSQA
ncbi:sensor histidine kinase [Nonomuraea longicatena]|uniref:histidine kinase n=1 Tax=Nonomuraea longicatena TaxID=83682 RepID=A0ABP4AN20_9ACTN